VEPSARGTSIVSPVLILPTFRISMGPFVVLTSGSLLCEFLEEPGRGESGPQVVHEQFVVQCPR
jgi:hypothetical protein